METVQNRLLSMADEEYLAFSAPLIPSVPREKMIGIRVPLLRKYAREIKNSEQALEFMDELRHYYMEENHLHGFLIENIRDFNT
ncbi:MAG: DNA alkylation repair protein, partial [Clostridia bacterium]|nr:DNA alkylation repair protein [Clostridia bacterium]